MHSSTGKLRLLLHGAGRAAKPATSTRSCKPHSRRFPPGTDAFETRRERRKLPTKPPASPQAGGAGHPVGYQPVDHLGIADAACRHRLGIHADVGEAGNGVELVDEDAQFRGRRRNPTRAMPSQPTARNAFAAIARTVPSTSSGSSAGTFRLGAILVDIFGVVGVEAVALRRHDLAGTGHEQAAFGILQHRCIRSRGRG